MKKFNLIKFKMADFNMGNNWKTMPNSYTINIEQNVRFQLGIYRGNLNLIKFKMADLWPFLTLKTLPDI